MVEQYKKHFYLPKLQKLRQFKRIIGQQLIPSQKTISGPRVEEMYEYLNEDNVVNVIAGRDIKEWKEPYARVIASKYGHNVSNVMKAMKNMMI